MKLATLQGIFNDYLVKEDIINHPKELYEPIQYIMQLGGKRIRPALTLLSYSMFKDDIEEALPIAYAIELFHNFTLMHDDIMDQATLRRGQLAVHQKYDTNAGILSGDAMLLTAYKYLLASGVSINDTQLFNNTAIQICEGQQMDMNFETAIEVSISEYLEMIKLKTAVLLGLALQLGAIRAGASTEDINHLYEFGINIGIAFQLHDDMLDAFGSNIGKKQGGDILQRKQTYLHIKTKELLEEQDATNYMDIFNNQKLSDKNRIEGVMKYYQQTEVKNHSLQSEGAYFKKAISHLDAVNIAEEKKIELRQLAHSMMKREF